MSSYELKVGKKAKPIQKVAKIAVLAVVGFVLQMFEFPIPIFPSFLQLDFSDLPAIIGSFAMGPVAGIIIQLVKNLLHLVFKSQTAGVGELANFITGASYVLFAGIVYQFNKTKKGAIIAMIGGSLFMTLVVSLCDYYFLFPMFAKALNFPLDAIVGMASALNPYVVDMKTAIIYSVVPFNLLKGVIISLITFAVYKRVSSILH
ncbi:MAG TPA: ECF transporter S component [Clostridia bacterium]|nr:ECF transporter S component [Clostridia bacterium]